MGKKISAVIVALVAAQLLTGCYMLRELSWGTDKVKPGDKTTATISLQPTDSTAMRSVLPQRGANGNGRFFLAVIGEGSDGVRFARPTFDSKDVTNQKEKLQRDNALFGVAFESSTCESLFARRQGPGPPGRLWRTEEPVSSDTRKFVESKLKARIARGADGGGFFGMVFTGDWVDDGDGVPEQPDSDPNTDDDQIACTGFSTTSFLVKRG